MNDHALTRQVAETVMRWNFRIWGFGEAIALRALLEAGPALNDPAMQGFVHGLMRGWLGRGVARSAEDHVGPARELLTLWERTGDDAFLDAARTMARLHAGFDKGPTGAHCHRPDTPGWRHQIWVDCMDLDGPFLTRLAVATGEDRYFDQAADELLGYARALQDESGGLFRHGHERHSGRNGAYWARGNGWALMGLAESLEILPAAHPATIELRQRLASLVAALATHQDEDGLWHTIVNDPSSYLETTLAAMIACSVPCAIQAGILDPCHHDLARRAFAAMLGQVDAEGRLALVSDATPIGEAHIYASRPFGIFPWGQGPLLLALTRSSR